MKFLDEIDVLILAYNEAPNIGRILAALVSFPNVIVLDSGSTDETAEIVAEWPNAKLIKRPFDQHAVQWNFGLTQCGLKRTWVLALDADYLVPQALVNEIGSLAPASIVAGYRTSFRYCVFGRRLSGTLYPPVVTLFRRQLAHYVQLGHTQRVVIDGQVLDLTHRIDHDDRKPLSRWFASQIYYASLEAKYLTATPKRTLRVSDRIRLLAWPAPPLVFLFTLFAKRCILDGWQGLFYVLQRTLAEILIALEVLERSHQDNKHR